MSQKVAIITGAARGIGAACAKKLSEDNYKVILHYRSSHEEVQKLSQTIKNSIPIQADLTDEKACLEVIDKVKKEKGNFIKLTFSETSNFVDNSKFSNSFENVK